MIAFAFALPCRLRYIDYIGPGGVRQSHVVSKRKKAASICLTGAVFASNAIKTS